MAPGNHDWSDRARQLLAAAEAGDTVALGELLELYRAYLLSIAREEIEDRLHAKVNPSDVVQDTFLEACRLFSRFHGNDDDGFRMWLRAILVNKLRDLHKRYFAAQNRQVERECSLDDSAAQPGLREAVAASTATPSGLAAGREESGRLGAALDRLPETYRLVLLWRTQENIPFAEIGRRLERSEDAARMLFTRALDRLEVELGGGHGVPPGERG